MLIFLISHISDKEKDQIIEIIKEGYSNIAYFTHQNYILRILLLTPEGMNLVDFMPENEKEDNEITKLVRDADPDQLSAFISSIFSQSYNLSLQTTKLKVERHDLVTQEGVTIALYGVLATNPDNNVYLGLWIDPRKGDEIIFRKGAIKLVDNLKKIVNTFS